jgi:hypothetical protein
VASVGFVDLTAGDEGGCTKFISRLRESKRDPRVELRIAGRGRDGEGATRRRLIRRLVPKFHLGMPLLTKLHFVYHLSRGAHPPVSAFWSSISPRKSTIAPS